jgi:Leucine-rich repeat (LRR) protein
MVWCTDHLHEAAGLGVGHPPCRGQRPPIAAIAVLACGVSLYASRLASDEPKKDADAARREAKAALQREMVRRAQEQQDALQFRAWELEIIGARVRPLNANMAADTEDEPETGAASRRLAVRFLDYLLLGRQQQDVGDDVDPLQPARSRLELLLRHNMTALELLCGLSDTQREKLTLAGKKDIARLLETIEEKRRPWQLVSDGEVEKRLDELQTDARTLRAAIDVDPFHEGSHFARMRARILTEAQQKRCRSMGGFDRLTTRVHLLSQQSDIDQVGRLRLGGTDFGDADMRRLARATSLRALFLDFTAVTDDGLVHLASMANLEVLDLGSTRVSAAGFAPVRALSSLQVLYLGNTLVTDAGLANLRKLPKVKKLDLQNTPLTGSGLIHLASLEKLETLMLGRTQIRDADLAALRRLENLKELELDETPISDAGLVHLEGLPNLFKLDLRRTHVTDAGLEYLKRSASLRYLYLYGTLVTDEAVGRFQQEIPAVKVLK